MNDPTTLSMADLEKRILAVVDDLETATHDVRAFGLDYARADALYDTEHAKALVKYRLATNDPQYVCAAKADVDCAMYDADRKTCEVLYEAAREAGRNARAAGDLLRSICANLRPLVTERT